MRGDLQEGNGCASRCQSLSFRAQNRGFCALLTFGTPIFGRFEHENGFFVSEWAIFPLFSGASSTKSGFLCFFGHRNPHFWAFRAQNRGFCALLPFGTPIFGHFEHKIRVFVLGKGSGERSVIIVWSIMVCRKVFVFVFDLIWRVWELVLRGIVECCIFDFWRLGGDWPK